MATAYNLWRPSHSQNNLSGHGATFDIWKMIPVSAWTGAWDSTATVQATINGLQSSATSAGQILPLTIYGFVGFSTLATYQAWINAVSAGIGSGACVLIIEPDALGLGTNMGDGTTPATAVSYAVNKFKTSNTNAEVNIDSSMWLADSVAADRLQTGGIAQADGFCINTSAMNDQATCYTQGDDIYSILVSRGVNNKKYTIDTSRNGNGVLTSAFGPAGQPWLDAGLAWQNPPGRGSGLSPRLAPDSAHPNCKSVLWIKVVGESDGLFPTTAQSPYYGENAPAAGVYWQKWVDDFLAHTNTANLSLASAAGTSLNSVTADFASGFGPFTANYGSVTLVSGRARVACATDYEALATPISYTLVGSSVFAQMFPPAVAGATTKASFQMVVEGATAGNRIAIEIDTKAGTIAFSSQLNYVDNNIISITYSATTHAWVRLRESSGTVFWETSPDSSTWTNRRTTNAATPSWTSSSQSLFFLTNRNSGTVNYAEVDNVNVVVSGGAGTALSTISADFASSFGPFSSFATGSATLVGGRARIACQSAAYSGIQTTSTYTLHSSSVFARMYAPVQGGAATEASLSMFVEGDVGNRVGMAINAVGNTISFFNQTSYSDAGAISIAYSASTHAWCRLRESSGTIYWETSSDGLTWTSRRTIGTSPPAWVTNLTTQSLQFQAHRDSGTVDYGEVDNVNILPSGATAPSVPTGVTATAGDASASVTFTLGADGGSAITSSLITSSPGSFTATVSGTGTSGTVSGLTNGTSYTFTVTSTNAIGTSAASAVSNSVTPAAGSSGGGSGGSGALNLWRTDHAQNHITGQGANFDIWKMYPCFAWTGSWNPVGTVQATISAMASSATAAGQVLGLVVYGYPTTGYSAGGFNTMPLYSAWIDQVSAGIGSARCIICLEPDALGLNAVMPDGLNTPPGTALSYAVTKFKGSNANIEIYIDSSLWLDNSTAAARLQTANIAAANGFSVDDSGYEYQSTCYSQSDGILSVLTGAGVTGKKYITDSSRNGNGPLTAAFGPAATPWLNTNQAWCNPPGRGAGLSPRAYPDTTNHPNCRGAMWIKSPGESDGTFPQMSDSTYFGEAAPAAGVFWQAWVNDFLAHTDMSNLASSTGIASPTPAARTCVATVNPVLISGASSGGGGGGSGGGSSATTWITVANVADGQTITTTWGNNVKAATDMLASYRPKFRAYRSSGIVIGNSAGTIGVTSPVNLETSLFDNNGMYSAMVITVRTPGVWMLGLSAEWLFNANGWRSISINKSDGTYLAGDTTSANGTITGINPSTYQYCTACVALTAGTILQARVAQSSGGNLALYTGNWGLSLCGFLVSA